MLRVLDDAARGRLVRSVSSVVYGHAARVLEREFRRDRFRRKYLPRARAVALQLVGVVDSAERAALLKLYGALEQLSAADRVLFVLHELELLSDFEIADALELPLLKTRRRLARALAKMEIEVDCDPVLSSLLCGDMSVERDLREGA